MFGILFCLGFLLFMGYRTVTASEFFDVKAIEITGVSRLQREEIERIVRAQTEKSGVWNADLKEIKTGIERLTPVRSAVVSRVLPDSMRVNVIERVPRAIVRLGAGEFWVDEDAVVLGAVGKDDARLPFVLRGWDEAKNENATKKNQESVRVYAKMLEESKEFDLDKRVAAVDLSDLNEPVAFVRTGGEVKKIVLPKDNFSKKLKTGIEGLANTGDEVIGINVSGAKFFLIPRDNISNGKKSN